MEKYAPDPAAPLPARPAHGGTEQGRNVLQRADVLRLRALLTLGRVELDLLVLVEGPVTRARDRGEVDENVRRSVIGGDEAIALVGVEPLHCSCCHQTYPLSAMPQRDLAAPMRAYR